jgi:hypothetical protein
LLILVNFKLVRSSLTVSSAKSKLENMFQKESIPDGMPQWLAVLDDSIGILSCLPTIKDGRCYKSEVCRLPKVKFGGKMMPFILKVCKYPYQIVIDFLRVDTRWYEKVNLKPIIINFNRKKEDGVLTVHSYTHMKKRIRWINYGKRTFEFFVDGMLRYDCTKPSGAHNWLKRAKLNLKAPNKKYTSIFYKLKIRIQIKKKKFNWFRFNYHCVRCEDVVNESGSFGHGPPSCAADMRRYQEEQRKHRPPPCHLGGPCGHESIYFF